MFGQPIEAEYPATFRKSDTKALSDVIKRHQSVELIGMKRVGISNFLRYYLYNPAVKSTYFSPTKKETFLFIPIDLNNLIERERYPFWLLTFKRILDAVEHSDFPDSTKINIEKIFDTAIQYKESFFIVDGIRKALTELTKQKITPVLFMIRFDRLIATVTRDLFANLQGLYDSCGGKLVYVFTSYQRLYYLKPEVFDKHTMSIFSHPVYVQPAQKDDMDIIFSTFSDRYMLKIDDEVKKTLIEMSGGHVNYLQLALIILKERIDAGHKISDILESLENDERIELQSEELFSYLDEEEQNLLKVIAVQKITHTSKLSPGSKSVVELKDEGEYTWNTGMIINDKHPPHIFSPLFEKYIQRLSQSGKAGKEETYLTSKEHKLFTLLKDHIDEICERELILETVWAEYEAIGVSDWAVDRLVARLRKKLIEMKSKYKIRTIRTRGFMLVAQ